MSYILDALRRADAERERGNVPGIHAQPARSSPAAAASGPPRHLWLWGLVALLLLSLGGLSWRLLTVETGAPTNVAAPASNPLPVPPVGVAAPPLAPVVSASPEPSTSVPAPRSAEVAPAPSRRQPSPAPAPTRKPASAAAIGAGGGIQAAPGTADASAAKIYTPEELPEDIRRDLPKLAVGGSIYSESTASRFVILNGQLLHEGDTLMPGLVLQQIKLKSAVLAFRGYRYRIAL